ncbi:MAG: preprotein translocase subunit SecG [Bdellovibrionales bacterium]|nr:preprotein translocase subunit SecG [Bdellovibrionales bacterium]
MVTLITVIHISVCVLLIVIVLLQQGKGSDMGAGFGGGGGSQSVLGARGAATVLSKLTTGAAVTFMVTSLALAYLSSKESSQSLLEGENPKAEATLTPAPDETPKATETQGDTKAESTDKEDASIVATPVASPSPQASSEESN